MRGLGGALMAIATQQEKQQAIEMLKQGLSDRAILDRISLGRTTFYRLKRQLKQVKSDA